MKKIIAIAAVALVASVSLAQTTNSSYFLDGFNQRYQINPAFAPERDIVIAVPVLSNLQFGAKSSAGLSNFIYQSQTDPNKLTTFMSSEVDRDKFLNGLPDKFQLNTSFNMDLLSVGVGGEQGYTVVDIKLRNDEVVSIPKEMFAFMKAGLSNGTYQIDNINMNSITYAELAVNHSRRINEDLRVGATVKILTGVDYTDINIDRIDADFSDQAWKVRTNATIIEALPGGEVDYDETEGSIEGIDYSPSAPNSFGFALDMGAEYNLSKFVEGLKVSASITDLGVMKWKGVSKFVTKNDEYVTFDGFHNYDVMSDDDNAATDQVEDDFNDMVKLYEDAVTNEKVAMKATFRAGAEYTLPWVDWIKCGELFTYRTGIWNCFESRTSVNLAPCTWFDFSANLALTTYGTEGGIIANIHPSVFNLFIACDCMKTRLNKQYIPLDKFGFDLNIGINLALGQKRLR